MHLSAPPDGMAEWNCSLLGQFGAAPGRSTRYRAAVAPANQLMWMFSVCVFVAPRQSVTVTETL